jgi:acyl transferase domain-containing protein
MAMEAASQLKGPLVQASGYRLRNVSYLAALVVPATQEGIEVAFSMRKTKHTSPGHQPWYEFSLRSFDQGKGSWTLHCTGSVRAECKQSDTCYIDHDYLQSLLTAEQKCVQAIDIDKYYRNLRSSGVFFGPTMQNVTDMKVSPCGSHILGKQGILNHISFIPPPWRVWLRCCCQSARPTKHLWDRNYLRLSWRKFGSQHP